MTPPGETLRELLPRMASELRSFASIAGTLPERITNSPDEETLNGYLEVISAAGSLEHEMAPHREAIAEAILSSQAAGRLDIGIALSTLLHMGARPAESARLFDRMTADPSSRAVAMRWAFDAAAFGGRAAHLIPRILEFLQDDDVEVRERAAEALLVLEVDSPALLRVAEETLRAEGPGQQRILSLMSTHARIRVLLRPALAIAHETGEIPARLTGRAQDLLDRTARPGSPS